MKNGWWMPLYSEGVSSLSLYFSSPLLSDHWSSSIALSFGLVAWFGGFFLAPLHRMQNKTREGMMGWRYKLESIRKPDPTFVGTVAPGTLVITHKNPTPQREVIQSSETKSHTSSTKKDRTQKGLMFFLFRVNFLLFSRSSRYVLENTLFHFQIKLSGSRPARKTTQHTQIRVIGGQCRKETQVKQGEGSPRKWE